MIDFEDIKEETLHIAEAIMNSNPAYNRLADGKEKVSLESLRDDLLGDMTVSWLVKEGEAYVGVVDWLLSHPKDGTTWLGLLAVHGDLHSKGLGKAAYLAYEAEMRKRGVDQIHLGVIQENHGARAFWEKMGFVFYATKKESTGRLDVDCLVKSI